MRRTYALVQVALALMAALGVLIAANCSPARSGVSVMSALIFNVVGWPTFAIALLVFGFAPGAVLRLIVRADNRDNCRRQELLAELYGVPRIERPFWVAEQLEVAIFEGLGGRLSFWRTRRKEGRGA